MTKEQMKQIFTDTDFVHCSGTEEETRVAEYLKACCEAMGVPAHLESFAVPMAEMRKTVVTADGKEIPAKGFFGCGSGVAEGELYYMPGQDPVSIAGARDKIALLDTQGVGFFVYQDLIKAGVRGLLLRYGNLNYPHQDIDQRELRDAVVGEARRVPCAMLNASTAVELVRGGARHVRIEIDQREYEGESHNVVAEIPGLREEYLTLTAHYDTTSLSHGAYDNMSGCVGILGVLEALKDRKLNYGLRLIFCGSEERGLLGSKAWVRDHEEELPKVALDINLDMIGTWLGKFIAKVSAEEKLAGYLTYMGAELGFPIEAKIGVYSSDSTPFADKGVPALSFARLAGPNAAPIHCRYDLPEVLSMAQMEKDIAFITEFTRRMANSVVCPVGREIPEKVKTELDEYLFRKRRP